MQSVGNVKVSLQIFSIISAMGPITFLILIAISTIFNPGYDHIGSTISRLAVQPNFPWIPRLGICIYGISYVFISWPIYYMLKLAPKSRFTYLIPSLLISVAFFSLMTGLVPDDDNPGGIFVLHDYGDTSISGIIHDISSRLSFVLGVAAMLFFYFSTAKNQNYKFASKLSLFSAITVLIFGAIFTLTTLLHNTHWLWNSIGLYQRAIILITTFWIEYIAIKVFLLTRSE